MKKTLITCAALALMLTACHDNVSDNVKSDMVTDAVAEAVTTRNCGAMEVLNTQLALNPALADKMASVENHYTEYFNKAMANKGKPNNNGNGGSNGGGDTPPADNLGTITIPVVVHVLYNTTQENISDAQINSQIAVLNKDFSATNADLNGVPTEFSSVVANSDIQFSLAQVIRKQTSKASWGTNDAMKSSSSGGSDVVQPDKYLNIWVCNIGGGILGYAQFPGGNSATDGVVISPQFFGSQGYVQVPFDKGRTATHEIGHYLNLRHIWGDGKCRQDDYVTDTPSSDRPNYGCPSYPTYHCNSNDMTMNYMDYVDDECMYMFTEGQKYRMRSLFTAGGVRESMLQ
ncbi:M43 family zinc metalloprotease [Zhouia sp. PK063]|uniref:M43 family zinc metalloprotease n=1 Tax=Zhouia sp. PK063 TaxID=3373602 RepID=UPI00379C3BB9